VVLVAITRGPSVGACCSGSSSALSADRVSSTRVGAALPCSACWRDTPSGGYVEESGLSSAWNGRGAHRFVSLTSQNACTALQFVIGPEGSLVTMMRVQIVPAALG